MRVQPVPVHDEAARQQQLDLMKRRATGLLVGATVLFVVARILEVRWAWMGIVRATMEAGMVGGLADWFAVTALFRHPLGTHDSAHGDRPREERSRRPNARRVRPAELPHARRDRDAAAVDCKSAGASPSGSPILRTRARSREMPRPR